MAVDSGVLPVSLFNPLASNRLETRDDVISACKALFDPLVGCFSPGKARVQMDSSASTWDRAATDLEAWARPLFGIVPLTRGESFPHWHLYREGLANGTDASHSEFWGEVESMDQR